MPSHTYRGDAHAAVTQHRSARRALERPAPQDGHPRMARLRRSSPSSSAARSARNTLTDEQSGVGESGQADADRRRTPTPRSVDEMVLVIQSKTLKTDDPQFRAAVDDVSQRLRRRRRRRRRSPGPVRPRTAGGVVAPTADAVLRQLRDPGDSESATRRRRQITVDRRRDRRRPQAAQKAHPDLRVEQFGRRQLRGGVQGDLQRRTSQKAGTTVAADHAAHPADRVRRAGGRRHPAAAGDHRRHRHDGPRRAAQPAHSRRRLDQPRHPADRPRRRRRLRAVLPAPGARGARRRAQQRSGASRPPRRPPAAPC